MLSNSVKYTKSGIVSTIIDWKREGSNLNSGQIKFTVSDTGCGIEQNKKHTLFTFLSAENIKDFETLEQGKSHTTKLAGTGLGISQKIVNSLGSKIQFTSTLNTGSRFWFSLKVEDRKKPNKGSMMISSKAIVSNSALDFEKSHLCQTIHSRQPFVHCTRERRNSKLSQVNNLQMTEEIISPKDSEGSAQPGIAQEEAEDNDLGKDIWTVFCWNILMINFRSHH